MRYKKVIFYFPRILGLCFAAFLVIFSFDVFGTGMSVEYQAIAFVIHNIPTLILVGAVISTWKHPKIAGLLFLFLALVMTLFFHTYEYLINFLLLTVPLLVVSFWYFLEAYLFS